MSNGGTSRLSRLLGKAGWNLFDQGLSSLTNIALGLLVVHQVSKDDFGAYSVAFLLFGLLIAVERAGVGHVMSIRHCNETEEGMREVAARAFGTVLCLAAPGGAVIALSGLVLGGVLRGPLMAFGILMAPLLLQDTARMVFFAQSKPHLAALNDTVWAVAQFVLMGTLIVMGAATATSLPAAWGASAGAGAVLAMVQLRVVPRPSAFGGWVRKHRDLLGYLLPETLLTSGGDKAAYFLVGGMIGLAGIGAVNGARQVLNPLLIITSAAVSFMMPEISRREELTARMRRLIGLTLGFAMAAMTVAYVGLVLLLPYGVGHWVFKQSWAGIHSVLLPMGLFSAVSAACAGPFIVIAGMGHAKRTFRLTVLQTVLLPLMPLGALYGGASGAAWGLCAGAVILLPFWIAALFAVAKEGPLRPEDREPAAVEAENASAQLELGDPYSTIPIPIPVRDERPPLRRDP